MDRQTNEWTNEQTIVIVESYSQLKFSLQICVIQEMTENK